MSYYIISSHATKHISPKIPQNFTVPDRVRIITTTLEGQEALMSDTLQFSLYYKLYGSGYVNELYNLLDYYGSTLINQDFESIKRNVGFSKYKYINEVLITVKSVGKNMNGRDTEGKQLMLSFHPGEQMTNLLFDFTEKVKYQKTIDRIEENYELIFSKKTTKLTTKTNINNLMTPVFEGDVAEFGSFFNRLSDNEFYTLINADDFGVCLNNGITFTLNDMINIIKKNIALQNPKYRDMITDYDLSISIGELGKFTEVEKAFYRLTSMPSYINLRNQITIFIVGCKVKTGNIQQQVFKQKLQQYPYQLLSGLPQQFYFKSPKKSIKKKSRKNRKFK